MQYNLYFCNIKSRYKMFKRILSSHTAGIFTHINPDGDALGSSIGMAAWLKLAGKKVRIFLPGGISDNLRFMIPEGYERDIVVWNAEKAEEIKAEINACDLLIGLDFNTLTRIGEFGELFGEAKAYKILIDHHVGPQAEAFDTVVSRTDISSASELLYHTLKDAPGVCGMVDMLPQITRTALLTGMTTDTNNFANSVYPSTLQMASELIASGTDREAIIDQLYFRYPERRIRAHAYIMDKLLTITDKGVAYIVLDSATYDRLELQEGDTEGFVNTPLSIANVRMSIFLKEEKDSGIIRVSLRSKKGVSARECALRYFNGGGHEQASGGRLYKGRDIGDISEAAAYIEKCTDEFFVE